MSILTDVDINQVRSKKEDPLIIENFSDDSLTPVGYDLRAGFRYSTSDEGKPINFHEGMILTIFPKQTALISTVEVIKMPKDRSLSALIVSKVSKVSLGLSHVSTTIDPDWSGRLLIAITNHSSNRILIPYAEKFCTVIFFQNKTPSEKPSKHIDNRPDCFVDNWSEATTKSIEEKEKSRRNFIKKTLVAPFIMIIGLAFGYVYFGPNQTVLVALATTCAAISHAWLTYITFSYKL